MPSMYLHDIPLPEAMARFESALESENLWGILGVEEIPLNEKALQRTLAEPVWAKISSPHYHAAAMDGFAVHSHETNGAMPTNPITLHIGPKASYVDTGDPLPDWADAVIPLENVEPLDVEGNPTPEIQKSHSIRIRAGITPWRHIRLMGEDMVTTQLVLPAGHTLRPVDLGAIAASGHSKVRVTRRPRVAILPTGSELVPIGNEVGPGEIIEFNSLVLASQVNAWGGEATRFPITSDNFEELCDRVRQVAEQYDLILLNAGSSAGSEDYSGKVIQALGEVLVHGVAVRPGHPVILGMVCTADSYPDSTQDPVVESDKKGNSTPIIGVPGYPVSSALTAEMFVEPLLARWLGRAPEKRPTIKATLTRKITSPAGDDDYVRVAVGRVGKKLLAAPLARGAGVVTSLVGADGLALFPRGSQGALAGAEVNVHLYRSLDEIEGTIFFTGSHDITLDVLAQFLSAYRRRLISSNVGSIGGLIALHRTETHIAGAHLLDPQTGEYNLSYVREYLPDLPVKVVALVGRTQGLLVAKGNPKKIQSLADLTNPEVTFVNRQRGAGTRLLLDYHLEMMGTDKKTIHGYQNEEYTHLAVGVSIVSGRADCGMGIAAVTHALNLDFIPLFEERYDLIIPQEYADGSLISPLYEVLEDENFRRLVAGLPGYDITPMGELIAEIP